MNRGFRLSEVSQIIQLDESIIVEYTQRGWIEPAAPQDDESMFDEEDIARARLIHDLIADLGVNEDAIPVILHLLDQLHHLRQCIHKNGSPHTWQGR